MSLLLNAEDTNFYTPSAATLFGRWAAQIDKLHQEHSMWFALVLRRSRSRDYSAGIHSAPTTPQNRQTSRDSAVTSINITSLVL